MCAEWERDKERFINYKDLAYFFFFSLFGATVAAYGGSQARGQIGAVANSSWQCQIINPTERG